MNGTRFKDAIGYLLLFNTYQYLGLIWCLCIYEISLIQRVFKEY